MSPPAVAVSKASDLSAARQIKVNGNALDPKLLNQLVDLRVDSILGLPDRCVLRIAESSDGVNGLDVLDSTAFDLQHAIEVRLGRALDDTLGEVFRGEVTAVEVELVSMASGRRPRAELVITAHDLSHRLHRKTPRRTFRQVTASDLARKLAGEHGLPVGTIDSLPGGTLQTVSQIGETDWAFLTRIVRAHGGELDMAAGKLHVRGPASTPTSAGQLVWGEHLHSFTARASDLSQAAKVTVAGWDAKKKERIVGTSTTKPATKVAADVVDRVVAGTELFLGDVGVTTTADAGAHAGGIARRLGHERMQGEAVAFGDPAILAGTAVTIKGVGTRFSGTHRVVAAVHQYDAEGYTTRMTLGGGGRPLAEDVADRGSGAGGQMTIGIVTQNEDPDGLGRVKVKYPILGDLVESDWARIAWPSAGAARGGVALPHVNDEVLVGFQAGDVNVPFVLGVLFNGKEKPGADLTKTTSSFAARYPRDLDVETKEKAVLATGKELTVKTTQGPVSVTAGQDALNLTAGKAVTIKASQGGPPSAITIETTGQLKMTGTQGAELKATGPLKISSTGPVTVESNAAVQLKGTAVQVQATGILQLSGATVMLG